MKQTENLKLNLPERTDIYNLDVLNENFKILDSVIQQIKNGSLVPFEIKSFTVSPSSVDSGVSTNVSFKWTYSVTNPTDITSITINDTAVPVSNTSYTTSVNITASKAFTLKVIKNGTTYTKSVSISLKPTTYNFYYGNYGATENEVLNITSDIVKGLTKKTQTTRVMDINISLESTEKYIIFAIPTSLTNNLVIYMNDFMGGIETIKQLTIDNIQYNIMRSDYPYTNELTNTMKISIKN